MSVTHPLFIHPEISVTPTLFNSDFQRWRIRYCNFLVWKLSICLTKTFTVETHCLVFKYYVLCTVSLFTYVAMFRAIIVHNSHTICRGSREFSKFCLEKNARDLCQNVAQLNWSNFVKLLLSSHGDFVANLCKKNNNIHTKRKWWRKWSRSNDKQKRSKN